MIDQHRSIYADHFGDDLYTRSRTRDRVLNAAIVNADISRSFEEYLEILDAFYADEIEITDEAREESICVITAAARFLTNPSRAGFKSYRFARTIRRRRTSAVGGHSTRLVASPTSPNCAFR
ncbi:MAG TPA: hypothetical protein VE422_19860 [Terriglobia bacterium]|nr:hypothetical protein [Terriglobia bacterium]